jgi:Ni,Fe-hydrogenase I large subunit
MTRLVVGPFNRVEGDLEVTLDVDDGHVRSAQVNAPMFRGFEQILLGRDALDALVVVPRICGICSVSQSAAAAAALARAMGVTPPPDGWRVAQLIQATENLADHLTHFYTFFMPDFAREAYRGHAWFEAVHARFKATVGSAVRDALPARMAFMQAMGLLAGKWPHTLTLQPGGTAQALQASQRLRLVALLAEFRRWLEERLFGDVLEAVVALPDAAALRRWVAARLAQAGTTPADLPLFLQVADDLQLWQTGRATDRYLATDSYLGVDGPLMRGGVWADGRVQPFDPSDVAEDLTHAWLAADGPVQSPSQGLTVPLVDKPGAYTWCKAPRWRGQVLETGALARQMVDGLPLLRDVVAQHGGSVAARVLARLVEVARVLPPARGRRRGRLDRRHPQDGRGVLRPAAVRGGAGGEKRQAGGDAEVHLQRAHLDVRRAGGVRPPRRHPGGEPGAGRPGRQERGRNCAARRWSTCSPTRPRASRRAASCATCTASASTTASCTSSAATRRRCRWR